MYKLHSEEDLGGEPAEEQTSPIWKGDKWPSKKYRGHALCAKRFLSYASSGSPKTLQIVAPSPFSSTRIVTEE